MRKKTQIARLVLLIGILLPALAARGHAFLDHASPKVGSDIDAAPHQVQLWFTEELDPASSTIQVFDAQGKQVDAGDSQVNPDDKTLLLITVSKLQPGQYTVVWSVVCLARHHTHGEFKFAIRGTN